MALTVPNGPATKTTIYTDLKGVDFSQDASLVDRHHSPDMLNMISDEGGSPVKRKGWEILLTRTLDTNNFAIINYWHFQIGDNKYHVFVEELTLETTPPTKLQRLVQFKPDTGYTNAIGLTSSEKVKDGYFMNDTFYIVTTRELIACKPDISDPTVLDIASVNSYKIPTIVVLRHPSDGGGTMYEDINLLTGYRTEQFQDPQGAGSTQFLLMATTTPSDVKLWYLNNGNWTQDNTVTIVQSGNKYYAKITTAHAVSQAPQGDNIRVTYSVTNSNGSKILNCTNHAFFSHGGLDQVFVTGNKDYPNYVWYSDYGDPTYFPDLNYIVVGSAGTRCKGFLNVGENLAVIKEQSEQDSGVYFIHETSITSKTVSTNTNTGSESETTQEYSYAVKRTSSGVGAISNKCFSILQDEPLFLSPDGVQGIVSTNTTSEKVIRNRSRNVDKRLLAEADLDKAISCVQNGYYYIFINDHVYVFDSRHTASDRRGNTSYMYEAYYWDNVPATCVCAADDTIYFGTADGRICRFKNTGSMTDYSDGSHYDEDEDEQVGGTAIHARWATRNDDDDAPQYFKTMMKKGTMCTVAPFEKSSVMVFIQVDARPSQDDILAGQQDVGRYYVGEYYLNVGNIFPGPIDFSRLLFDARQGPRDYFFRKKKKKYIRLQIILENATINEGFGVFHVVKTFSPTRYAK